ncbi:hypothetical protein BKA93DRAFT_828907 [Sparassis latifolia]
MSRVVAYIDISHKHVRRSLVLPVFLMVLVNFMRLWSYQYRTFGEDVARLPLGQLTIKTFVNWE